MTEGKDRSRTRARILATAERLFHERGYHATTLQEIADQVGITKPALYYHFDAKAEILASLLEPMTSELELMLDQAVAAGEVGGIDAARAVLIPGWVDVFLRSRGAVLALIRELATTPSGAFDRILAVMERAIMVAGGPEVADQVAIAQAISSIADPVALLPHIPGEVLREHLLTGAWRLLGETNQEPGRRGRGGRPRALSADEVERARRLYADEQRSPDSIAELFGVSRATMYRYLRT